MRNLCQDVNIKSQKSLLDRQVSQMNAIFMIADKCERYCRDIEKQFQDLKEITNGKADLTALSNVEAEFRNYTTLDEHNKIKESLKNYGEVADISKVRESLINIKELVEK